MIIVSISIFQSHPSHTLCENVYHMATNFDPELGSLSGHDTRL
jgi:hypothetical protein